MDARDDLTDLERRLTVWRPAGDGLDADALVFAAGRASARSRLWPALTVLFAATSLVLGVALQRERSAHAALTRSLMSEPSPAVAPAEPGPGSFAFRRVDPETLFVQASPAPSSVAPPESDTLRAWPLRSLEP